MTAAGREDGAQADGRADAESYARRYHDAGRRVLELENEMAERLRRHAEEVDAERAATSRLREQVAVQADEIRALSADNGALRDTARRLEAEVGRLTREADLQGAQLRTILDSRSWRATRLVRELRWVVFPPQGADADPTRPSSSSGSDPPRSPR